MAGLGCPPALATPFFSLQLELDTEYSDPFDAQPHPPPSDDGYMEPYDAQRAVSGARAGLGGWGRRPLVGVGADQCS